MEFSYIIIQVVIMLSITVTFMLTILALFRRKSKCSLDYLESVNGITLRQALELCVTEKTSPMFKGIVKLLVRMLCIEDLVKLCKE